MSSRVAVSRLSFLLAATLLPSPRWSVWAHEIPAHQLIGDTALLYLSQNYPDRPSLANLQTLLRIGAAGEDDDRLPIDPLPNSDIIGRYYFHFSPALNFNLPGIATVSATCASPEWGLAESPNCALTCIILLGSFCSVSVPETNAHRWSQTLGAPDSTGAPSEQSIKNFGYVVHLLEDLGSPAHARNDLHACPWQKLPSGPISIGGYPLSYCDVFEKGNVIEQGNEIVSRKVAVPPKDAPVFIDTTAFFTPAEFFTSMQAYTSANYFSNDTVFQSASPALVTEDLQYFYGDCIGATLKYGVCETVKGYKVRKIASKGPLYYASCLASTFNTCINSWGGVNLTVAQEQFDELGPVIAQHVAAFVKFYAPALTVAIQGTGKGKVFAFGVQPCTTVSAPCSGLITRDPSGKPSWSLSAQADAGSTFAGWSGTAGCSGTAQFISLTLNNDQTCTATFSSNGAAEQALVGYGLDVNTVTVTTSGGCEPTPPFNNTSNPASITAQSLRRQLPLLKVGDQWQPASVTTTEPTEIFYPEPRPVFKITSSIDASGIVTTQESGGGFKYTSIFQESDWESVTVLETIDLNTGAYHRVQDETWTAIPITKVGCQFAATFHGVTTDVGTLKITLVSTSGK